MRLLQIDENSEFSLTDDLINNIPPYAILSHTWGEDHEEVSFIDLTRGPRRTKAGYKKLRFCAKQAARDSLQYFWVDTCCINKENNTELSEAITSMYRWYSRAAKCYVYLSDVSIVDDNLVSPSLQPWESAFRNSRWFTRGWTLQELLAPPLVEFFCSKGTRLGDKRSLEQQIHEITRIPAKMRQTKRGEDKAYSLLGLFDVSMPLIYGEGDEKAFRRLQKEIRGRTASSLDRLPYAIEAPFNSFTRQHEPACLDNTRVDLLNDIYVWADGRDERCIFWLNGMAGTGKSTIARTVARRYYEQQRFAASFFFSKGGGDIGHARLLITSIAMQITQNIPASRRYICEAIAERNDIVTQSLRDQWQQLVLRPLSKLGEKGNQSAYVLVIDALDECDNENNIRIIIHLLAEARSLKTTRLRIFLTSRPEIPIRNGFCQMADVEHRDFLLHDISPSIVDHDLSIFFEYNLKLIGQEQSLDACWPGEEIIKRLIQTARGLFIWAATACRFIHEGKRFAARRLDTILSGINSASIAPEKHLDEIYTTVLQQSIIVEFTKEEKEETLNELHSVIDIPKDRFQPLRLHHPSFRDYLLSKSRCQDPNFWVNEKQAHQVLAENCLRLMSTSLKQDICGLNAPGKLVAEVARSRIDRHLPPEVQYSCLYWMEHIQKSSAQLCDNDQVHHFLQKHLLHWLEALGWIGKISEGIYAIIALESFVASDNCPNLSNFIYDAKRFVLSNRSSIEQAPIQTYCSALIFAPTTSMVRKQFADCIPKWIKTLPRVEESWNIILQTLEGHSGSVGTIAFSPDGKILASGSSDETVQLWDARSGAALQKLSHLGSVSAVAFSPNGRTLASGSKDTTIKLWDPASGVVLQTLEGHLESVLTVAFLPPDGETLVSGSRDGTVKLWDAGSGVLLQTLSYPDRVSAMAFSLDGKMLAFGLEEHNRVQLWDIRSGTTLTLSHSWRVSVIAFSPDSKTLASVSLDGIKLWDVRSGVALQMLESYSEDGLTIAFSPDGKTLASGWEDRTIELWDTESGVKLQTLQGYSNAVSALAFSPDGKILALGSWDKTVKLWDAKFNAALQTLEGHSEEVNAIAFSPDGKMLASGSTDCAIKLWDTNSGAVLQTLGGPESAVLAVAFSPDGKTLASGLGGHTEFKLWDIKSGAELQTLKGHSSIVSAVTFSPDSKILASGSWDTTVKLWDAKLGVTLQTLEGHLEQINAIAFSSDGKTLALGSEDGIIELWDATSGAVLQTFDIDYTASFISFNSTSLLTDRALLPSQILSSVFAKDEWLSLCTDRILWLPTDRRATCVTVFGNVVGLGHKFGRVTFMAFDV
ncbi:hypothetical protein EPUS_03829 [Endocarpon pusillum Z07020]|uniref:Uncharacterized protein n=1 Tax=Endocarpon pusillum (strain Z07020 / HMAS-L-300199) TaxID=1263415 RepID=U1HX63_ENDPU|nr:uncharacterized protein EPUS_03829 [Endocarpon pusillum Z07020]ERF74014.1 hypothetical protein EPUS_03829 [Endocarpon pusillum Z07020]